MRVDLHGVPLPTPPPHAYLPPQPVPADEVLERVIARAFEEVPGLRDVLGDVLAPSRWND